MSDVQQFFCGRAWLIISAIVYLSIIVFGLAIFTHCNWKQFWEGHPRLHRIVLVAFLSLIFAPGILPDWLIIIPIPATFGLILLAPNLFFNNLPFSDQRAFVLLYIYPLLFGFAFFYIGFFFCDCCRSRRARQSKAV